MYNKPVRAVIREWSTNAVDACIAAGKTPEFTVNVPTVDNPVFSVRDYGTGLPLDKIKSLFFRLGASSKRDSNDFNGTLG
jgi:DNA topoisomerase VI subunit B